MQYIYIETARETTKNVLKYFLMTWYLKAWWRFYTQGNPKPRQEPQKNTYPRIRLR